MNRPSLPSSGVSRRRFLQTSAAAGVLPLFASLPSVFAAGSDRIKIGLVGCGGRGVGALRNCIAADPSVQLHALGDIFADRVQAVFTELRDGRPHPEHPVPPMAAEQFNVIEERCFSGFDAYKGVINSGIDLVLLVTPPHFRPLHMAAAVEAGVHMFIEKPVAVDPIGARRVIEVSALAEAKGLAIVAGTQRRHSPNYLETMARIADGAIGELTGGQCYWLQEGLWHRGREAAWTDMEYQVRNGLYFTWLSGDHIVEQHVHNIDVMNWAFGGPPVSAMGMGGRQSRTDEKYGDAWDHFSVEFEYANGARVQSLCRQVVGASSRVGERLVGTKGTANPSGTISGETPWKFEGEIGNAFDLEHVDLIRCIREGKPINHGKRIAESTLTAILGRISAYSGREVSFNWLLNASALDLTPAAYEFGPAPEVRVPVPGATQLV